ncbi:hypothetical protein CEB3_c47470 [Peptococcaceae bacterium CEB3]|nr:hypothetical protein CEB3_c47470 [Peptococcaceae bacterium CEB3]
MLLRVVDVINRKVGGFSVNPSKRVAPRESRPLPDSKRLGFFILKEEGFL